MLSATQAVVRKNASGFLIPAALIFTRKITLLLLNILKLRKWIHGLGATATQNPANPQ